MISGKTLVSDEFLSCGFFDDYCWHKTSAAHLAPLLFHYRTGCYRSLLHSVYWWSGPKPGCLEDWDGFDRKKKVPWGVCLPTICSSHLHSELLWVPKYPHPAAQSLFPCQMDPQYWVPPTPLANSTESKSSFLKYHCWNLFLLLPARGQSIFKTLSSFYLYGTQRNVQVRHIRRTNGLLKRLWTLFLLQSLALGGSGLITKLASTGRK